MVYCFLANGFEIIEAMAPIDMLKRAKIEVKTVGVGSKQIASSNGTTVICDEEISDIKIDSSVDAIILPGGMPGTLNLEADKSVQDSIDVMNENNKLICAICAAPSILGHKGLLNGKNAVAYPGFEKDLTGAVISDKFVVTDGNIITAKGAGSSIEFGLEVILYLKDKTIADSVKESIQYFER